MPFNSNDISFRQQKKKKCTTRIVFYLCLSGVIVLFVVALYINIGFYIFFGSPTITTGIAINTPKKESTPITLNVISTNIPPVIRDPSKPFGDNPPECFRRGAMMDYPMSGREQELRRIYTLVDGAMKKLKLTYWPADGTFLGILRQGRVANDHDFDFHVLTSLEGCRSVLRSLINEFKKVASLSYARIFKKRIGPHYIISTFAVVRFHKVFGFQSTGPDFFCVHRQSDNSLAVIYDKGLTVKLPLNTLPLVPCRFYDLNILCPGSGYTYLLPFAPRYNGCVVFPHCFGDPETTNKQCLTPHRPVPLDSFVQATLTLEHCNYGNLAEHYRTHPYCSQLMLEKKHTGCCHPSNCAMIQGKRFCFLQNFSD